jgi:hypothetical protein
VWPSQASCQNGGLRLVEKHLPTSRSAASISIAGALLRYCGANATSARTAQARASWTCHNAHARTNRRSSRALACAAFC